jgi:crotonobetainyl-CoA:carnitine CoA-transferase CaiB-like acyl-CoA transferase
MMVDCERPLADVRVLDLASGHADLVSRLFADLGADVLKIEPPRGSEGRKALPAAAGLSISFALHNANKRSAVLNPYDDADRRRLIELAGGADIVIDGGFPGLAAAFGTSCAELSQRFAHLVAMSVTDFGADGPRASWRATDPVMYALSTALSSSGPPTGAPVLPPDGIATATAAAQAAWAALVAYYHRLRYGTGDYIDFSRFEAVVQALDPPFGSVGQAAAGHRTDGWRGRPRNQDVYPIFACKDGYVRICVLSPRQWRGLRSWLGEPERFADPRYDRLGVRFAASKEIGELVAALFADQTMGDLVAAAQACGVPIAAVLTPPEALSSDHFRAVGALTELDFSAGARVTVPVGNFVIDGEHLGFSRPAPRAGAHSARWMGPTRASAEPAGGAGGHRPFDGIRILDLGVIVAGGELGRLFADMGAEVIKVESMIYPDGLRQTRPGQPMSESFALTHRNEYGLGVDLRDPAGADIFGRLVGRADAVFANFKPGTLASLGFPYETLRNINPRIVLAESSAFGDNGPWSVRMGYGPLVRAATGITRLWDFCDATTIFPDHVVARITAIAALAALIRRDRTGCGAHVHISQAEAAVNQLDTCYVTQAARVAGVGVRDDPSTHGVYPCAGDDEWCVISIRGDEDRRALAATMGRALETHAVETHAVETHAVETHAVETHAVETHDDHAAISAWTSTLDKAVVADLLQRAGVPAGPMNRPADVLDDPQLRHRKMFTDMAHPLFDRVFPTETGPAPYRRIPAAELRPAPMPGQHTREICRQVPALDVEEIERLIADGALFAPPQPHHPPRPHQPQPRSSP